MDDKGTGSTGKWLVTLDDSERKRDLHDLMLVSCP